MFSTEHLVGLPKGLVVRCSQTFSQVTKINGTICEKQSAGRSKDIFLDDVNKFIFGMAKRKSEAKHEETFLAKGDCNKGRFVSGAGSTQQNARWSRMAGRGREEDISNSLLSNRLFFPAAASTEIRQRLFPEHLSTSASGTVWQSRIGKFLAA